MNRVADTVVLQAKRDPSVSTQQNVKSVVQNLVWELHFTRRQNLLVAILDIIHVRSFAHPTLLLSTEACSCAQMYKSDQFPEDMVTIVNEFVLVRARLRPDSIVEH